MRPKALIDVLRSLGKRIVGSAGEEPAGTLDERVSGCLSALEQLGGAARAVSTDTGILIRSESCPFADAVSEHPEVCQIAESMVEEMVGAPVREICDRTGLPKCRFEISTKPAAV